MTVASTTSRVSYATNGITTNFPFANYFINDSDLVVIKKNNTTGVETPLVLDTDYTVAGAGVLAGGSITTIGGSSPLIAGFKLTIYRDPMLLQELDLVENDPFPPEEVEKALDLLTMMSQRESDWISRAVRLSDGTPVGAFDPELPTDLILFGDSVPKLNAAGTGWDDAENWPTATDIENAEENALIAKNWATQTDDLVHDINDNPIDNSAKSYAIGGTGAGDPTLGNAKAWALRTGAAVVAGLYSAKEWALGSFTRGAAGGGSAKDWANYVGGTVDDTEFSAKEYAIQAAASASEADAAADSIVGQDVLYKTFADSPINVLAAQRGNIFSIDASGGAVVVNLPQISGLDLTNPFPLVVKKSDNSANTVTVNAYNVGDGTDKIETANLKTLESQDQGCFLYADTDKSPDSWTRLDFGPSNGGGGGGALRWIEGASAPIMAVETDQEVYSYEAAQAQDLFCNVRVPSSYVLGHQIKMKALFLHADSSGNALLRAQSTLIRPATDAVTSSTNQRTTTNSAVSLSGGTVDVPQLVTLDLTDTIGKINSVSVSPGDLIKVRLYRDTDTATGDLRALPYNAEVTFT